MADMIICGRCAPRDRCEFYQDNKEAADAGQFCFHPNEQGACDFYDGEDKKRTIITSNALGTKS